MASLRDLIGSSNIANFLLRRQHVLPDYAHAWVKKLGLPTDLRSEYKKITIIVANVNFQARNQKLLDLIKKLHPMLVLIIEPYAIINPPINYSSILHNTFYKNVVWIRNDLVKQRTISRIPYGIQIDNIALRYIPPSSNKCQLDIHEIEVGDFNFLSNPWLELENIYCENRYGKPGGVAICTKLKHDTKFINIGSDHKVMYTIIDGTIKAKKKIDNYKLTKAIIDATEGIINKDVYTLDKRWKEDRNIRLTNQNQKLINPVAKHLDLDPYKQIYHHDERKTSNFGYTPQIRSTEWKHIQSKAEDVNNFQIRKMIELTKKLSLPRKQNVLNCFRWIQFNSRTVFLRKKGKEPNKITNLRPIQISPWTFKIAEQSRTKLKNWLDQNTHAWCYAFKKKKKIADLIAWIKSYILPNKFHLNNNIINQK